METERENFVLSDAKLKEFTTIETLLNAEISSQVGLIKQHVENGFPVDYSADGWNFLHTACFVGNIELLEFLLLKAKEKGGHICKKMLNERFLKVFVEPHLGIIWNYLTPLQLTLTRHGEYPQYKLSKLLVDYGADVNLVDKDGCTPLHIACRVQLQTELIIKLCKLLIDSGADVNSCDEDDITPLHTACSIQTEFTTELCKLLIDSGANVNSVDKLSCTPLHTACRTQTEFTVELCKLLIDNRANVNFVEKDGHAPLHTAFRTQTKFTVELCKLLIDTGANVNFVDKDGFTPLLTVCRTQTEFTIELCKLLIDTGANVNFVDKDGFTPLHTACKTQTEFTFEICKLLIVSRAVNSCDNKYGFTPLHTACWTQTEFTINLCKLLIDSVADVNFVDVHGCTPLHTACMIQTEFTVELCKLLIDNGAEVNSCDKHGYTPLHNNCINHSKSAVEICKLLFVNGAGVNISERRGHTPLYDACAMQSEYTIGICKCLLDHGADVNFRNEDGNITLHNVLNSSLLLSDSEQIKNVFQLLLDYGANINTKNNDDETPIACFITKVQSLSKYKNFLETFIHITDMFEFMINTGADLKIRTHSQTFYHYIVELAIELYNSIMSAGKEMNRKKMSQILSIITELLALLKKSIKGTTPINSRDEVGNTPLHLACRLAQKHCHNFFQTAFSKRSKCLLTSLVDSLISCGSKVNAVNDKQQTPLHFACTSDVIKTLLQLRAKPNSKDDNGNTPMLEWTLLYNDTALALLCFSVEDLTEYFKQGVDPFLANYNGDTVFQVLLSKEKFVCAQNFIKAVVDIDRNNVVIKDKNGDTFLHVVCKCDDDRVQGMIELLLRSGADPNVHNQSTKETPLHVLCRRIAQSYVKVHKETKMTMADDVGKDFMSTSSAWAVQLLRKYGANPEALDGNDKTCLDIAVDNRLSELEKVLRSPVEQIESPFLLPWEQKSVKHRSMLAQVARHQKSKQVDVFHYHSEPIGSGAFGHVHVGISKQDGQEVAVKRMELLRIGRPEDKREIANLLHLRDCEQIIKYQTYHMDEHFLYIILELMDGSLDELICHEEDHVDLCRDVMSGIVFLHNNGVIHRDIKPGNILYKSQPRLHLKLADFGLSTTFNFSLPLGATTVMHTTAFTRCWSPIEILETGAYSEASDVFSAGLVLHHILAEKKHAFGPKDETGMSESNIQHETEGNIRKGLFNLSETISPEACHLLKQMLQYSKDDRPTAAECLNQPFFWSKKEKKDFLCAVGNQPEFQRPRHVASSCGLSSVETDLENEFASEFSSTPWDIQIPQIYMEMTSIPRSRRCTTSSAVDLVRFVRNSYAHVSDRTRSTFFQKSLHEYVYFEKFPKLVITVYDLVMKYAWNGREEIKHAQS